MAKLGLDLHFKAMKKQEELQEKNRQLEKELEKMKAKQEAKARETKTLRDDWNTAKSKCNML